MPTRPDWPPAAHHQSVSRLLLTRCDRCWSALYLADAVGLWLPTVEVAATVVVVRDRPAGVLIAGPELIPQPCAPGVGLADRSGPAADHAVGLADHAVGLADRSARLADRAAGRSEE